MISDENSAVEQASHSSIDHEQASYSNVMEKKDFEDESLQS